MYRLLEVGEKVAIGDESWSTFPTGIFHWEKITIDPDYIKCNDYPIRRKIKDEENSNSTQQTKVQICPVCLGDGIAANENGWCECCCDKYAKEGKL